MAVRSNQPSPGSVAFNKCLQPHELQPSVAGRVWRYAATFTGLADLCWSNCRADLSSGRRMQNPERRAAMSGYLVIALGVAAAAFERGAPSANAPIAESIAATPPT